MSIAYFASLKHGDIIEVVFTRPSAGEETYRLLVDSGFVGESCFILPNRARDLAVGPWLVTKTDGALHGVQERVLVSCGIASLAFQLTALAIVTDTTSLGLPAGVDGLAGLTFLRQFRRWGSEQLEDGTWRFFLETATT